MKREPGDAMIIDIQLASLLEVSRVMLKLNEREGQQTMVADIAKAVSQSSRFLFNSGRGRVLFRYFNSHDDLLQCENRALLTLAHEYQHRY